MMTEAEKLILEKLSVIEKAQAATDEWHKGTDKTLNGIVIQTRETNGRVNTLERQYSFARGGIIAIYAILTLAGAGGLIAVFT